jgi:hypothetical protein
VNINCSSSRKQTSQRHDRNDPLSNTAASVYKAFHPNFQGFVELSKIAVLLRFIHDSSPKNFQSYYLTVDRCAVRDGSSVCTDCVDGLGLYRVGTAPNNLCMTTAEFPAGYGIDTSQPELANPVCIPGWYEKDGACFHPSSAPIIPDFFGANLDTGKAVPCKLTGCLDCKANFQGCAVCNNAAGWYWDPLDNRCESANTSPKFWWGQGPNLATNQVASCQVANCAVCKTDHTLCTDCFNNWFLQTSSNTCYSPTVSPLIPAPFGANWDTGLVAPCIDNNCLNCIADVRFCSLCDTANSWYLNTTTDRCNSPTLAPQIAELKGANLATGMTTNCQDGNCRYCRADYTVCTGCKTISGWYLDGTTCRHATTAPVFNVGTGPNLATGMVVACSLANCGKCSASYLTCTACVSGWYFKTSQCYHPTLAPIIPDNFGANTGTGTADACQVSQCKLCKANYQICDGCNTGWYLLNNVCYHPTSAPTIPDFKGANTGTGMVVDCGTPYCKLCKADYLTCTGCDTANGWYLDGNTCEHATNSPIFPAGKGPKLSNGLVVACQTPNCQTCSADYTICDFCISDWYLLSNICYHPISAPTIPDFKGGNTGTGMIVDCGIFHCKLCKVDYLICTGCDTANGWYLDGNICEHATDTTIFSAGQGPNLSNGLVVPCQTSNCQTCSADYTICTVCASGWFLKSGSCYHPTSAPIIPDFFGANSATGTADSCQVSHCKLCKTDYTTCTGCDTAGGWYLDGNTCRHATNAPVFPAGKGPNLSNGLVEPCQTSNCQTCSADYTICTVCTSGWFLKSGSCYHPTSVPIIPDFFGANTGTGTADACQVANCKLCKTDYTTCTGCDTAGGWYLDGNTCRHATNAPVFPAGKGPNLSNGLVEPCQTSNCQTCSADYTICTICTSGWFLKSGSCYHPTSAPIIPDFFGANTGTGTADACQVANCKLCKTDYTTCTGCDTTNGWYLDGNTCEHATDTTIFSAGQGPNLSNGLVVPCQTSNCQTCSADYTICTVCASGWFLKSGSCYHPTSAPIIPDFFGANTGTGTADACQVANCKLCKTDYTTCTGCDTGNQWYLNGNVCESPTLSPQIADGNGANTVTGVVTLCQTSQCKLCKADYLTCTGCYTVNGWYLDGNNCEHATNAPIFPVGKGPNLSNGLVEPCQQANCQTCSADHTICTVCTSGWFLKSGSCYHPTSAPIIPDFFGANTGTGTADACQVASCKLCKTDYTVCTGCDTGNQWYLNGNTCESPTLSPQIADGYGADLALGTVGTCQVTNCVLCKAVKLTCTGCNTAGGWYLDGNTCEHATSAPTMSPGQGPNLSTGLVVPCQDANCLACFSSHLTCTACDVANGWYLDINTCVHESLSPQIPNQKGPNHSNGRITSCAVLFCKDCKTDYTHCDECITGYDLNGQVCDPVGCPPGEGRQIGVPGVLIPCASSGCISCCDDASVCLKCDQSKQFYLEQDSCKLVKDIKAGRGGNQDTGEVDNCLVENCIDCQEDIKKCNTCKDTMVLNDGKCVEPPKRMIIQAAFTSRDSTAVVKFSAPIKSKSIVKEPLPITFVDTNLNKNYTCDSIKCKLLQVDNDGFTLQFDSPEPIVKGDLYINKAATFDVKFDDGIPWLQYPIKVPDVSFLGKQVAAQAASQTLSSMNSARLPISIAISFAAPAAASFLDILINTIFVLKLIEGPLVVYPDSILSADMDVSMLPINLDNPLQKWIDGKPECVPSAQFARYDYSCNLLDNEAMDTAQLVGLLLFTIVMTWVSNSILRLIMNRILKKGDVSLDDLKNSKKNKGKLSKAQIEKRSKLAKAVGKVGTVLGLQFFFSKIEGNQIQLFLLSVLALRNWSSYSADIASTLLAMVYVGFYAGLAFTYFLASLWIWEEIERKRSSKRGRKSLNGSLSQGIRLENSPYSVLNYTFEELKVPDHYWQLLLPVTSFLRTAVFSLVLTGVLGKAWQQATLVLMVEVLSMVFDIMTSVKMRASERYAEIAMRTFTIIFLVFKLISTSENISDSTRQTIAGIPMAGCLVGLMVVGLVFAVWTIGVMLVDGVKMIIAKIKALKEINKIVKNGKVNESDAEHSQNNPNTISNKEKSSVQNESGSLENSNLHDPVSVVNGEIDSHSIRSHSKNPRFKTNKSSHRMVPKLKNPEKYSVVPQPNSPDDLNESSNLAISRRDNLLNKQSQVLGKVKKSLAAVKPFENLGASGLRFNTHIMREYKQASEQ